LAFRAKELREMKGWVSMTELICSRAWEEFHVLTLAEPVTDLVACTEDKLIV